MLTPLLLALVLAPDAALAQDAADYAQQLAELRAEVEALSAEVELRKEERLAELDRLEAQVDEGVVRPQQAVSRVWQFLEDELRLTRENAPDRQIIDVQGTEVLASVARVGMLSMYFRTDDGRVGRAVRSGDDWTWEVYTERTDVELTNTLFDDLEKQIRVGWFELPNALGGAS